MAPSPELGPIPLLALRGITKRYPGVVANDGIDLDIAPGEIHALLGENGAGKSTLVKVVFGVTQPDEGEIRWHGRIVKVGSPHEARRLGIGMVFQHFSLFEALTVLENVALGLETPERMRALAGRIATISRSYGLPLDPDRAVHALSVGERQRIEIVRCLLQEPRLLIMDEPTSVLTPQEVERLFETLRALAADGCAILYISHKLEEVRVLCERATVLRQGRVVASCDPRRETARTLAAMMIGTELGEADRSRRPPTTAAERFVVRDLDVPPAEPHDVPVRKLSLSVRAGEILGIAGVAGNGQRELLAALAGERRVLADSIMIDGRPVGRLGSPERRRLGLCYIPEERNGTGAVGSFDLADNAVLGAWRRARLVSAGFLRRRAAEGYAQKVIDGFDVRTSGPRATAASLSGGNLQKFIVGREIYQTPVVLIAAQPTWGVDAGAAAAIHEALRALAAEGTAILLVSQDLDEILSLCDRLAVLNAGRLSRSLPAAGADVEEIGLLMGGLHDLPGEETAAFAALA
jgi:simple sugar transport system ATP-binding protein